MSVSGKILFDKFRSLRLELSNVVTPEVLDKVCEKPSVQPFLKWFCENVNNVNILSSEDVQIKKKLQETNEWLEGPELDNALEEATRDYPDLLKITDSNGTNINDLYAEFETLKESCKEDESYICTLRNGIQNLKKVEAKLDEDIEKEEELLDREKIEADKAYKECSAILTEFNTRNHEFFKEVESLLNVYADAAENKGVPVLWTQMPLELFTKNIELYNRYIDVYIKQQFENMHKEEEEEVAEEEIDSNCVALTENSNAKRIDNEKLQELALCKTNLIDAKMEQILAKVQEESYMAMFNHVQDIYNSGNLKVPRHSELRVEIAELTKERDFLEETVSSLQECQLSEVVHAFSEMEINKVLVEDARARLERAQHHLEKLKKLLSLVREHGHVHTDLLCMLMSMQRHRLKDIAEFIADARHYLTTEYLLSSTRCEKMQQQQNEYYTAVLSSPNTHNSFHKLFTSMICNGDDVQDLNSALDKYNDLLSENEARKHSILKTCLNSKIQKLKMLENEVNAQYANEIQRDPTHTFIPISFDIETCHNEALDSLQKIQTDLTRMRTQMKERLKANVDLDRETTILWQRFLADPDTLRRTHKEIKQMANKSCFTDTLKDEL
ncbi:HAUS augmin-like complex subunit 3 [Xylocopa sonorina]|uniref:HAUS augmin-like complex subunit 3 n=1 Tax=Xylocopa sonorina TaxID=1818115 RepID=UPI00403AADD5